jgi:hypothetical protein
MTAAPGTPAPGRPTGAWVGLVLAAALLTLAFVLPHLLGWDVKARSDRVGAPPTHGYWQPGLGPGTAPAALVALVGVLWADRWARRARWSHLLLGSYAGGLAWLLSLALVDGTAGLTRTMTNPTEYLLTARAVDDVPALLSTYVDRIPLDSPDNWPIHVAGHPPGALLMFVALVRLGLGGDLAAGLVVTAVAATIPLAVLVTCRALGVDDLARRAAPFLVLTPAAVFLAVSADAVFAAVGAWGLAALGLAARARRGAPMAGWALLAGLLLGWAVLCSYGLPLLGLPALAVLVVARSWWPLPVAVVAALVPVLLLAAGGFAWWEAYPVLVERYWDGLAADRPAAYWMWGNLAALLVSAGPLLGAGLGGLAAGRRRLARLDPAGVRAVLWLVGAAAAAVALADLSQMSKSEVERIWLPFVPWLTLSLALLPSRWRRAGLGLQVLTALVVQHLLYTTW